MKAPLASSAGPWSPTLSTPGEDPVPGFWPNRDISQFRNAAGIRWHLQRKGAGDVVLLIHGTGSATHTWRDVMPLLAAHFDVIAIDLPGHGFSSPSANGAMSLNAVSAAIDGLLAKLKLRVHAIVGHSAGAAIALDLVIRHNVDPQAIIGVNAALLPFGGFLAPLFAPLAKAAALVAVVPALVRHRVRDPGAVRRMIRSTGSALDEQGIELYRHLLSRDAHVRATLRMMADWDLRTLADDMEPIARRCHLLVGDQDRAVSPGEAEALCGRYPDMQRTLLPGLGHLAQEENPSLAAACIRDAISAADSGI